MHIFIGSTPNTTEKDIELAKGILNGKVLTDDARENLEKYFQNIWTKEDIFLFNRGREAMYFLFQNLNLQEGDEVVLQPFTCLATLQPILWSGCRPVFVDIKEDTLNMDLEKLKKSISLKTRVVLIQHTFGNMVNMQEVRNIIDDINNNRQAEQKIFILEDCAHLFSTDNESIGKFSDAFFFSFAQDKAISCTQGALLVVKNRDFFKKVLKEEYQNIKELPMKEALYNARYILLWEKIKRLYYTLDIPFLRFSLGKFLILLYRFLGLIKKQTEGRGEDIRKLSNIQAKLLLRQLEDFEIFNTHRKDITNIYNSKLSEKMRYKGANHNTCLLRYPILSSQRGLFKNSLRENRVISGNWYNSPIFPLAWNELSSVGYVLGSCAVAESCCRRIFNLPTGINVSKEHAEKIADILNRSLES